MEITTHSSLDWLAGIILISASLAIYFLGRKSSSAKLFATLSFITGTWSCLMAVAISLSNLQSMQLITETNHLLGTLMPTIFLLFCLSYPDDTKVDKKILIMLLAVELLFIYLLFFTHTIISQTFVIPYLQYLGWSHGQLILFFDLYLTFAWLFGIVLLLKKFKTTIDPKTRQNILQVILAVVIGVTPPAVATILLPQIGIFDYYWLSPVSGLIWILLITYAITRHQLFNIRIITVQLVTFTLWIILFVRTIFAPNTHDAVVESILLIITIIFGVTLLRSVLHEIEQKKRIEELERELRMLCGK